MGEVKDLELSKIVGNEVELSEEVGGRVGNILVTTIGSCCASPIPITNVLPLPPWFFSLGKSLLKCPCWLHSKQFQLPPIVVVVVVLFGAFLQNLEL